jgi:parvulin-like peptidyl-prolyl isomerase
LNKKVKKGSKPHTKTKSHAHKSHPVTKNKKKDSSSIKTHIFGVVIFVVLVAIVYFLITMVIDKGITRGSAAATVNGEIITMEYLEDQYSRIPANYQQFINKETLLNQTINEVLLLQEAKKEGLSVSEDEVSQEISKAMLQGGISEDELDDRLAEQNMTVNLLKEMYTKQLTINKLLEEKILKDIYVSEEEVSDYYNSKIHAMHILVKTEDEAYTIIQKLRSTSKNLVKTKFGELATEFSTDPSAKTSAGDLGEFSKGQMVSAFEEAAFALEEYEYTRKPVKTQFGFHVILRLPKESSLKDASPQIREVLAMQKKASVVPAYVEQLKANSNIVVTYKAGE